MTDTLWKIYLKNEKCQEAITGFNFSIDRCTSDLYNQIIKANEIGKKPNNELSK